MVGLVFVSHSRMLAEALVNLTRQMAPPEVPIAIAAGVGDQRESFGTDAVEIMEAILSVDSPDGVLVLMDLGSAILSAEMAVELLPPEVGARVKFCAAPLVEGALVAGVQSGLGSDLETVCREAQQALAPKIEQIGGGSEATESAPAEAAPDEAAPAQTVPGLEGEAALHQAVMTLKNQHGLHARPAAQFVQTAGRFKSRIRVTNLTKNKGPVNAASLNALATLGAVQGSQIRVEAEGPEAEQAVAALEALVNTGFGEPMIEEQAGKAPAPAAPAPSPAGEAVEPAARAAEAGAQAAVPISEGIALGPFYKYQAQVPVVSNQPAENPVVEWERLEHAVEATRQAIDQRRRELRDRLGAEQAAIFEAHLLILQDPDIRAQVRQRIESGGENAGAAWNAVIRQVAESYRALEDEYLQQRAADVEDIGSQVLLALEGRTGAAPIRLDQPVILFAQDITPTETSQLDMSKVLGLMTAGGGPTSHSAILARALGIPAVSGVSPLMGDVRPNTPVAIDGQRGLVWIDPPAPVRADLEARRQAWIERRKRLLQTSHEQARTRDGRRVEVFANVGGLPEARAAVENGAEGVGLLRTEFLFLTRETPPTEDEQAAALREIGDALGSRPVTVRTMDIGGDKEVPYIAMPREANPFLGVRAIRLSFAQPETLFMPQLRAILRAGAGRQFRVMFPMVANADEVRQARGWLEKAHRALEAEGTTHAWPIETGIMVEIPSAALLAPQLAKAVDFFSIGTNDLTQYTLAAERGNPMLASLADAMHPAVLRLIGEVASAAHTEQKWVGVCGELAGDPVAAAVLVGLGVDELSLNPGGIPTIKAALRSIDSGEAQALARQALALESAAEVRRLVQDWTARQPPPA